MSIDAETFLSVAFLLFLITASVVGNLLVIISTITSRQLRRFANILILNLSIADLLITCTSLPLRVCQYFGYNWASGQFSCQVIVSITIFVFTASNVNLFLVTMDRFFGMLVPFRYKLVMTNKIILIEIIIGWIVSFSIATFPFLIYGKKRESDATSDLKFVCTFSTVLRPGYVIFVEMGTLVIPWMVMIAMYSVIFVLGYRSARNKIRVTLQMPNGSEQISAATSNKSSAHGVSQEWKLAKTIFIILFIYFVLMFPIAIMDLINTLGSETTVPYAAIKVGLLMAYANPAVNPPIYAAGSERYRKVFLRLLGWESLKRCWFRQRHRRLEPEHTSHAEAADAGCTISSINTSCIGRNSTHEKPNSRKLELKNKDAVCSYLLNESENDTYDGKVALFTAAYIYSDNKSRQPRSTTYSDRNSSTAIVHYNNKRQDLVQKAL